MYGIDGFGFYLDNIIGCYNVILEFVFLVLESVRLVLERFRLVFIIVDYGCVDGGIFMLLFYVCVKELWKIYGDDLFI